MPCTWRITFLLKIRWYQNLCQKSKNAKNIEKLVLISSLLSPILAKLPKEVNNLNRFFKKKAIVPNRQEQGSKSYAQALLIRNVVKEVLKIKKTFLKLQASKIENIQKIIHESNKPKPYINMTTKSLSHKQVIVPMNNENKNELEQLHHQY